MAIAYKKKGLFNYSKNPIQVEWARDSSCLNVIGRNNKSYHQIKREGRQWALHRWVFYINHGYLPEVVMHSCDNTHCVNPLHLIPGNQQMNCLDARDKGRAFVGELNGQAKLTEEKARALIREITTRKEKKIRAVDLQKKYNISAKQYKRIAKGESWRHLRR